MRLFHSGAALLLAAGPALATPDTARLQGAWLCQETQFFGQTEGQMRLEAEVDAEGKLEGLIFMTYRGPDQTVAAEYTFHAIWSLAQGQLDETPVEVVTLSATLNGEDVTDGPEAESQRQAFAEPNEAPFRAEFHGSDLLLLWPQDAASDEAPVRVITCRKRPAAG